MRRRPVKRKLTTYQFHTGSITKDEKGNIVRISRHKPAMKHDKTLWWCCAMCRTVRHYDDIGRWVLFFICLWGVQIGLFFALYEVYEISLDHTTLWVFLAVFLCFALGITGVCIRASRKPKRKRFEFSAEDLETPLPIKKENEALERSISIESFEEFEEEEEEEEEEYKTDDDYEV